jgi:cytochrome P450
VSATSESDARPGRHLTGPISDPATYAGDPFPLYERLRVEAPVAWHEDPGFWVLTRHADVLAVSRDPVTFCSSQGILIMDLGRELPDIPGAMLYIDPPTHQRYRRLAQPAFAPSRVRALEGAVRQRARELIGALPVDQPVDVVAALALPFPLLVIADLLGVPAERWPDYAHWSEKAIDAGTEQTPETDAAMGEMVTFLLEVIEAKRADPGDDLISVLSTVAVADPDTGEEEQLDEGELMMLCIQLLVAGNETTRNLISGGLVALAEHPEQWDRLVADPSLVPSAVEELLRWTTPVISFLRTATRDTEVGGQAIAAGEPLLLLYSAANRDPDVFGPTADQLDVARPENHHLAFGFGEHFCLGAMLARLEGRVVLEELLATGRRPEPAGEVRRLPSAAVVAGLLEAPLRFA